MAKEDYFIRIQDPKQTRRTVLENTRDVLKILQGYEDFKKIRHQRTVLINSFKTDMGEIRSLVLELRRLLPKMSIKEVKTVSAVVEKPAKELKKLEDELSEIEEKLSSLS
jgi:hypothetical protein